MVIYPVMRVTGLCNILVLRASDFFLSRSEGLDQANGASTGFMFTSVGVLPEGYGHAGPGVCLGDGQTKAEGVPSQGGRGDALFRRILTYLTSKPLQGGCFQFSCDYRAWEVFVQARVEYFLRGD